VYVSGAPNNPLSIRFARVRTVLPIHFLSILLVSGLLLPEAWAAQPVSGRKAMVVAQEPLAADVGLEVLKSGGNAVDAAVAVGFAMSVTYPYAGNIGGGGFMLIRLADGRTTFIDFREKAPGQASHDMYLDSAVHKLDSTVGWRSAGVPGTVRGFQLANAKYGTRPWVELIQPAIRLATNGFPISRWQMESFHISKKLLEYPDSKRIFLKDGAYLGWQEILRQPELGRTLGRIALNADDFYTGETAQLLTKAMQANGGLITLADLASYRAVERKPLEGDYAGYHIITAPPPSSGGICLLQMLGMLDGTGYETHGAGSAASYHYEAEVMRRAFADRSEYLGDPDFVTVPVSAMLNPVYLSERRAGIEPTRATSSAALNPGIFPGQEGTNTTHFSILDEQGNAVAVTYTLNLDYGSGITVPGAGFLLNDEMDDFATAPGATNAFGIMQGEKNAVAPNKRPVSSMTPTIVLKDNRPFLILGAPGGPTIITAVLQVMLNVIDFHMNVQEAVDFPRIHQMWNPRPDQDILAVERGVSPDTIAALEGMGHKINAAKPVVVARVEAILVNTNGWVEGAHDGRGIGKAVGY
jgi:gamma-glutamyltranspeptidase / glutathione hydrolase